MKIDEKRDLERIARLMQQSNAIFVFGSNLRGVHGAGQALAAVQQYGARHGCGQGFQGRAYALPTKVGPYTAMPLDDVRFHVRALLQFAGRHPTLLFVVPRVGCGRAGFTDDQIAPLFDGAPANIDLPYEWRTALQASPR
jgi:hypothetical protein